MEIQNISFRNAEIEDREFILNANKEINVLSGLNDSTLELNIDKDMFEDKICKTILVEVDGVPVGFILYSYIYWANCGKGIYLSQAYVKQEYRKHGLLRKLLEQLEKEEKECKFITNLVGNENEIMMKSMEKLHFNSSDLITYYRKIEKY